MTIRSIVVATDGSPEATRAVEYAADIAGATNATVTIVHVFEPLALLGHVEAPVDFGTHEDAALALLRETWSRPLTDAGVAFDARLVEGRPVEAIIELADETDADLIVVGARGRSVVKELLLGSTSLGVLHHAHRPVTVVPSAP